MSRRRAGFRRRAVSASDSAVEDPAASSGYTAVAAGVWHSCGLRADDTVVCWGDNTEGQADTPEGTFTAISAGLWHSCGLRSDATIACWGDNEHGQSDAPPGAIAAGDAHTCGLATDNTIACWGDNQSGHVLRLARRMELHHHTQLNPRPNPRRTLIEVTGQRGEAPRTL